MKTSIHSFNLGILQASFIEVDSESIRRVFLQISDIWYVICNDKSLDSLCFKQSPDPITLDLQLRRVAMISQFEELEIYNIGAIEQFGFEIKFKTFDDQSLMISAFADSLKIGVANYICKL